MKTINNLAVVGATGLVGQTMLKVIDEQNLPFRNLRLFASERSAGKSASLALAPELSASGCIVIDNSSAWRMHPSAPLTVPEVNPESLTNHLGIIGNPNCSTIQMVAGLKPIEDEYRLRRIVVSTYQSVSGAGQKGIDHLTAELEGRTPQRRISEYPLMNNLVFHDFPAGEDYTEEEIKMKNETRKIFSRPDLRVAVTCVRVPEFGAHGESVLFETEKPFDIKAIRDLLERTPGIIVKDDPSRNIYPTVTEASGRDEVFVGRLRADDSAENSAWMWVVSDNLRKGAATNAVSIASFLLDNDLMRYDIGKSSLAFGNR